MSQPIINKFNVQYFLQDGKLKLAPVYPIGKKHFKVLSDIKIKLSDSQIITIKAGFKFDGSSAPRFLWAIFPSYGDFLFAALIHDWMYVTDYRIKELGLKEARLLADKEMLIWSNVVNNKNVWKKLDNKIRYFAVRLFGKPVYKR